MHRIQEVLRLNYALLNQRIERIAQRMREIENDVEDVRMEAPATETEIEEVERALGVRLPASFRTTLLEYASSFSFYWFLDDDFKLPVQFRGIFSGTLEWGLELLQQCEEERKGWVENVFPNVEDSYDAVWHNKLAFLAVVPRSGSGCTLRPPERAELFPIFQRLWNSGHC